MEHRCTAKSTRSGERCKRPPIRGGTVCATHGGSAPQVRDAAQRRLLEAADNAAARLVAMLDDDDSKVVLAAARDLLDRAGLQAVQRIEADVETTSREALIDELVALMAESRDEEDTTS